MAKRSSDKVRRTMQEIVENDSPQHRPIKPVQTALEKTPAHESGNDNSQNRLTDHEIDVGETTDFEINDSGLGSPTKFSLRKPREVSLSQHSSTDSGEGIGKPFLPPHRPRTPLLYVMDDNQETAEVIRLRAMQTVIGRSRGDILIENDAHVSDRHAEIRRELKEGTFTWVLNDLRSTNGTYVKVLKQNLAEGDCLLLGQRYFRFSRVESNESERRSDRLPSCALVQFAVAAGEKRQIHLLNQSKPNLIGNGQAGPKATWKDEFLDQEHARIACDQNDQWCIEDLGSLNGTWIKTQSLPLLDGISFQLGGQRFTFCIDN